MKIAILKERRPHESRVATTPDAVKKLLALGAEIVIEAGAGLAASFPDQVYADAGATIFPLIPAFYYRPTTLDEMAREFAYRVLAHLGLAQPDAFHWKG